MNETRKCFAINDGVDGIWSLDEMLEVNYSDPEFCAWANGANAGDTFTGIGEKCTCIGLSDDYLM